MLASWKRRLMQRGTESTLPPRPVFLLIAANARESETGREEETEGGKAFAQSKEIDTKKARASERQSAIYRQTISLLRFDCVYVLLICVCVCVYECELCAYYCMWLSVRRESVCKRRERKGL